MKKHILVVSFIPPSAGTGSSIILKRHLQALEHDGWKISIVAPEQCLRQTHDLPETWQIIPLIGRRWWWLPLRPQIPGLLQARLPLWQRQCEQALGQDRPTAILSLLYQLHPHLSVWLSKRWSVPLSVIIHDQEEHWATSEFQRQFLHQRDRLILQQAKRVWFVSQELKAAYSADDQQNASVLYPISERVESTFVEWRATFQTNPVVVHAGSLHPFQFSNFQHLANALQTVNGTLFLIAPSDNPTLIRLLKVCPNIQHCEPFAENADVFQFLKERASCVLVSYSFSLEEQPWGATSFPSKLVEFSQLGLPILILAPQNTAIANWATQRRWLAHIDTLESSRLVAISTKLTERDGWLSMAQQTRQAALTEFNPIQIQSQFETELAV